MKEQSLTPEQRRDLVVYRFERAHKTIEEAKYLRDGHYYNAAVNRLYYACFYASLGLLVSRGISTTTHQGVKTMISMEFIRKGLLDIEHGATLGDLFNQRHTSDYNDFVYNTEASVNFLLPKAEAYIEATQTLAFE